MKTARPLGIDAKPAHHTKWLGVRKRRSETVSYFAQMAGTSTVEEKGDENELLSMQTLHTSGIRLGKSVCGLDSDSS